MKLIFVLGFVQILFVSSTLGDKKSPTDNNDGYYNYRGKWLFSNFVVVFSVPNKKNVER